MVLMVGSVMKNYNFKDSSSNRRQKETENYRAEILKNPQNLLGQEGGGDGGREKPIQRPNNQNSTTQPLIRRRDQKASINYITKRQPKTNQVKFSKTTTITTQSVRHCSLQFSTDLT